MPFENILPEDLKREAARIKEARKLGLSEDAPWEQIEKTKKVLAEAEEIATAAKHKAEHPTERE